jgi:hypothetical protein
LDLKRLHYAFFFSRDGTNAGCSPLMRAPLLRIRDGVFDAMQHRSGRDLSALGAVCPVNPNVRRIRHTAPRQSG